MTFLQTIQILFLLASTAVATILALHAWQHRPAPGNTYFALLMFSVSHWSLSDAMSVITPDLPHKLWWVQLEYLGMALSSLFWLLFVLDYTNATAWLTRWRIIWLMLVTGLTILLTNTNAVHSLVWQSVHLENSSPFISFTYGPGFWLLILLMYAYLFAGSAELFAYWRQQNTPLYRGQVMSLLLGLLMPWGGNVMYLLHLTPFDLTPFAFSLTGLLLVRFALRFRLFDINPVAHRMVVNSMAEGVLVLDRQDRVVDINVSARHLVTNAPPEIVGRPLTAVWPRLAQHLHDTPAECIELPPVADGLPYHEISISPLYDPTHNLLGRLLIVRDITERKRQESLRQDMTRSLVHDLRAPISNTLFALEMLKSDLEHVASPDDHLLLEMTFVNTEKTLQLVNQIMELHRLESGYMPLALARVSLSALTQQVLTAQQARATGKQINLLSNVPDTLPSAWIDAVLLERVLQNLVDNAIKFSPTGGTVTVTAVLQPPDQESTLPLLLVSVHDEGPGIPLALHGRLFEKYVTGNTEGSGSGLGLSFCRMALAAHGQRIWFQSQPGQGTTFRFTVTAVNPDTP